MTIYVLEQGGEMAAYWLAVGADKKNRRMIVVLKVPKEGRVRGKVNVGIIRIPSRSAGQIVAHRHVRMQRFEATS
jgi:hypothetical protein